MSVTFQEFLDHAKPGTKYVYHIGLLMKDRQQYEPWSRTYGDNEIHFNALKVWEAQEKEQVYLVQQRQHGSTGLGVYVYFAVKRRPSANRTGDDRRNHSGHQLAREVFGPRPTLQATLG